MRRIEPIAVALATLALFVLFYRLGGGPRAWDELLYMSLSRFPVADGHVLNRYFHIYFQKLFMGVAGNALDGARMYWAFLFAATVGFVYASARLLGGAAHPLNGALAVWLFLTPTVIMTHYGDTHADATVMLLGAASLFAFLVQVRRPHLRNLALVAVGACLLLAVKSKESGIVVVVVAAALFVGAARNGDRSGWPQDVFRVGAGMAGALALLMALDAVFLGDPWFQFRPGSVRALLGFNLPTFSVGGGAHANFTRARENWFGFFGVLGVGETLLFLLYLLAPWRGHTARYTAAERVTWMLPLALIVFLNVAAVMAVQPPVIHRYILPALPFMAVWGSHFFSFAPGWRPGKREAAMLAASVAGAAGLLALAGGPLGRYGWTVETFFFSVAAPTAIAVFLGLFSPVRRLGPWLGFAALGCLVVALALPTYQLVRFVASGNDRQYAESRFAPFARFQGPLAHLDGGRLFISSHIQEESGLLCRNLGSCQWMYQVHFNQRIAPDRIAFGPTLNGGPFQAALLSARDLKELSAQPETLADLQRTYRLSGGPGDPVYLLLARVPAG